ncbi:MAG: type IV toxin-antitoxin system AbiEi family antitoxin domain-containing protein [Gudongella sp.]|nr:type IV toxin-antitoxin system AbiEi family antitoxin domain-containing protein [Gudongella sp.]
MRNINIIKETFNKHGGILKASELNVLGLSSRQIKRLIEDNIITRIKHGFYELTNYFPREEVIIARLFPDAVIFLESAMMEYGYTDRIPSAWQIAVNKDSNKKQYEIEYPFIEPYYLEPKFIENGINIIEIDGVKVRIYDRDRTICDTLRYENKLEEEVFTNAIKNYIKDPKKNVRNLYEYAEIFNIKNKVQTYLGVWL